MVQFHHDYFLAVCLLLQVLLLSTSSSVARAFVVVPTKLHLHSSGSLDKKVPTHLYSIVDKLINNSPGNTDSKSQEPQVALSQERKDPHLVFPGGGLFFYWQAGVVTHLREQGYAMDQMTASGASAGALTATLMATNVDFVKATELALEMADDQGVWDRSGGLQGIWGPIVYDWLDQLLPENALELVSNDRLSLLVTPVPSFGKETVSSFESRRDLIECNMASVHLPWFLDGKLTSNFRNRPHIDGSFLAKAGDYVMPNRKSSSIVRVDWNKDPEFQDGEFFDFVKVISPEGIWQIFEKGKEYAKAMEARGRYKNLPKVR